ncbi:hypothetical protein N9U81_02360 [Candidatus Pelagibacter sp.]|nr:hypothetical protein [Candidatus Pelagibacter sp.]|tara:strand:- start:266 stop:445 length:180 start_codon:yes stop_codon:yes gene_type:complete
MQFIKKTRSSPSLIGLTIKISLFLVIILAIIFLLNKIEFPAPVKEIEKIIPNENFKVVK